MKVYLDNAASTPLSQKVRDAVREYLDDQTGNPSGIHRHGVKQRSDIEKSRKSVANHLKASIGEIFFTSGGTESNNTVLKCAITNLGVTTIISSPLEHPSIINTLKTLNQNPDISVVFLPHDQQGNIDEKDLRAALEKVDGNSTLVTIMHANNEIGTIYPIERFAEIADEYGAYFHTDATQTLGHLPISLADTKIDYLSASAHKFHGLKGAGILYMNAEKPLKPYIEGGGQERNMRAGTENVLGILSTAMALDEMVENMDSNRDHIISLRNQLKEGLKNISDDIDFNGNQEDYLFTVLSVTFPKSENSEMLIPLLDIDGISASGGSACSSGSEKQSHVISAIRPNDEGKTVRFSFSHLNTSEEIDYVLEKIQNLVTKI